MKHEPRPAIHREKQLGWGRVSGDLQGGSKSVSQIDGVSNMASACCLCGSMEGGFRKGIMVTAHLDASHFSLSQYATGALQTATLVLELRGSKSSR